MELPDDLLKMSASEEGENHGIFSFQQVMMRHGELKDPESGRIVGVLTEFHLPYLPWLKFRIPWSLTTARYQAESILEVIERAESS